MTTFGTLTLQHEITSNHKHIANNNVPPERMLELTEISFNTRISAFPNKNILPCKKASNIVFFLLE